MKYKTCPKTTHDIENIRIPLIAVIEPFGTSVLSTAFVLRINEKHVKNFTNNEAKTKAKVTYVIKPQK